MEPVTPIRILLVDEQSLLRESVARVLSTEPGFRIVGKCVTSTDALAALARIPVDVLLLDVDMGLGDGTDLLREARTSGFTGRVLVLTSGVRPQEVSVLLRSGIAGVVLKHESPASLCQSIRDVAAGKVSLGQELLDGAVGWMHRASGPPRPNRLSERERRVVSLVLDGLANRDIAARLGVSEPAVKKALHRVFAKAGVRTRGQLVRVALEGCRHLLEGPGGPVRT